MLADLARGSGGVDDAESQAALQELVLYLLQLCSPAALALAAGAIAPDEGLREPARAIARDVVQSVDPQLEGYGRAFRRAGF